MSKYDRILEKILSGSSDANISFDDLCHLLKKMGFDFRVRGSHHLFFKPGVMEQLNLQKDGNKAKRYQVKQLRSIILHYKLRGK